MKKKIVLYQTCTHTDTLTKNTIDWWDSRQNVLKDIYIYENEQRTKKKKIVLNFRLP